MATKRKDQKKDKMIGQVELRTYSDKKGRYILLQGKKYYYKTK